MGNVQGSSNVNQMLPIESYVMDVPELRYIKCLGATRFLKTALTEYKDGVVVVKLFICDHSEVSTDKYLELILLLRKKLKDAPNCLPYSKFHKTDKSVIVQRLYQRCTLYDRLSTRPFLLDVEKLWLAFQLCKVLGQLRINMVCHGDIKSHNVLISSTNWLRLTDFAPFKLAFIPYDNPSAFTFYFDTSRRRTCYLAPERFKRAEDFAFLTHTSPEAPIISEGLTHEMDIFAVGCVLVELLTDGRHVAFNLSQAVDYTMRDEHVAGDYLKKLLSVCPEEFRSLLASMLDRNPVKRREQYEALSPCTSDLFPPLFEQYLYTYMKDLQQIKDPDQIIIKLYVEFPNYKERFEQDDNETVVLLINVVTANIRACRAMSTKMDAIALLKKFCELTTPEIITDRIIPYLVFMLTDYYAQVRGEAVYVITDILESLESVPQDEGPLLVDYIFPRLKQLTEDKFDYVKMALASCLGRLAAVSLRFFEESVSKLNEDAPNMMNTESKQEQEKFCEETVESLAKTERDALHEAVSRLFVNLSDSSNAVKECLFAQDNLTLLCTFFGTGKSADADVLMHMIALLNDKYDWQLRAAFFKSCPAIAKHSDPMQNSTLVPFLQQGLQDSQEFVTYQTITSLYHFCNDNKLEKRVILDIARDAIPFLVHPNKWFRAQVINLLSVLDLTFSISDVYCKIIPLVKPFLKEPLIRLNEKQVLKSCLMPPITRQIWDFITQSDNIGAFLKDLSDRRTLDKLGGGRGSIFSNNADAQKGRSLDKSDSMFQKMTKLGLTEEIEDQLLGFQFIFNKMEQGKKRVGSLKSPKGNSKLFLKAIYGVKPRAFDLEDGVHRLAKSSHNEMVKVDMFTTEEDVFASRVKDGGSRIHKFNQVVAVGNSKVQLIEALSHKRSCYLEQKRITGQPLRTTPDQKHGHVLGHNATATAMANAMASTRAGSPTAIRRPELRLQNHLHEHSGSVMKLSAHPYLDFFASCSTDKTVKLWSTSQFNGKGVPAIMSKETVAYNHQINAIDFLESQSVLMVTGSANGEISVSDWLNNKLVRSTSLDKDDGPISQINASEHLVIALTHHSKIHCFDVRTKDKIKFDTVYMKKARNSCGLITGFTVDPSYGHWMLLTGSSSTTTNMVLWDLRFGGLEVSSWSHPSQAATPFKSWAFIEPAEVSPNCHKVITNSSKDGELSLWDVGTKDRTDIMWPSQSRPLLYQNELVSTSVVSCPNLNGIFSGDSEGSIRYWNLDGQPFKSNYLVGPYRKRIDAWGSKETRHPRIEYSYAEIPNFGSRVQVEDRSVLQNHIDPELVTVRQVGDYHHDSVVDMVSTGTDQLISAGNDGVIKVWKVLV